MLAPRIRIPLLAFLTFIICCAAPAFAQNPTFALEGVVEDAQQAVLPGVTITVHNVSTGLIRTVTTDEGGRWVVRGLPPEGRYKLQAELTGFATEVRDNLTFNAGQRVVMNFSMKLSTVQETITVSGDAPLVQTTSAEVTSTIDQKAFENLPVKERNYFRLLTLDSNVVATGTGSNAVNVGGGEVWNFGTYVDGTNNHSKWLTLQRAPQLGSSGFAIETVKEVQLITNQFSAEFGGHSAGVASMITKSGTNAVAGSGFVMIRPGQLDSRPPLSQVRAPYKQQQFGGTVGGPLVRDHIFYFGSYERRRERSSLPVTSPARAPGQNTVATPADEHQGHFKGDIRFSEKNSLGVRYNMVRWKKDNESGGFNLPGTGFNWDNNVDTVHGNFLTVVSDRFLNEVRSQFSRYVDRRAAKCDCVSIVRQGFSTEGGYDQGTWGVLPEKTYDVSDTVSLWMGNHTVKTGASITYDVTEQLFQPLQNGQYSFSSGTATAPFQYIQSFALVPEARLMFPKATVIGSFVQDDWRVNNNLTLNLGLRYDVEIIRNIPDYPAPTDKNNIDPRVGFAWDPKGDQKWAIRGGFGRFTQQHPIFTIVKGGVGGRNGQVTVLLSPTDPLFPTFPNPLPAFPPGAVLPPRNIQEIAPDLENEYSWNYSVGVEHQLGPRTTIGVDANLNRGHKHGFLDFNQPTPFSKADLNARLAANPNAVLRTVAQADLTRPNVPGPNTFRRMDVLTNEGRFWYQGVRVKASHRTDALTLSASYTRSKSEDRLNHWFSPEDSSDPELDRGPSGADTPNNLVTQTLLNVPGSGPILSGWRLAIVSHHQSGSPYTIRYAGDPIGAGFNAGCSSRGCQASRPEGRNTERGMFINYADVTLGRRFALGPDHIEFRADVFNVFNNWNLLSGGYINLIGNPRFGQHTGGGAVWPGRQFQFATTYRF
jgi:outer membrane receptor protein involved in Fe transport